MKKWIWTAGILLFVAVIGAAAVYAKAREPFADAEKKAVSAALEKTELAEVDKTYFYNGQHSYVALTGKGKDGKGYAAWVPNGKKGEIIVKELSAGISEKDALKKLNAEEDPKKILGVRLGMEENMPVWEISYLDKEDRLNYYYIHFETGQWWRKIENL